MKNWEWRLFKISFLVFMLNNLVSASGGDSGGDFDGSDHHDSGDHHHSDHHHNNLILGLGGYYDPWLWSGYYNPGFWGGNYYNLGFFGPDSYGYRSFGYTDPFLRPYYASPTTVAAPSRPPAYIQQQESKTIQTKNNYWYYCRDPEGYYPHIKECPGGWLQVAPQPSAQ